MLRNILLLVCFFILTGSENKPKWKSLFNGKDLKGWEVKIAGYPLGENFGNTFRVENGILQTRYNAYDSFRVRFGALYFKKKFSNYRLKVDYRFTGELTPGAPSWGFRDGGVQYHSQTPASMTIDQPFPVCLEYNLHGGNGKDDRPVGEICANGIYVTINGKRTTSYCTPATVKKTCHGDQWVTLEIDVQGDKIKHFVNGEEILQFDNPRFNPEHGLGKKFIVDGKDKVTEGYISLQSNSHPMDFRKIEIMVY